MQESRLDGMSDVDFFNSYRTAIPTICRMHQAPPRGKQIGAKSSALLNDRAQLPNIHDKALNR